MLMSTQKIGLKALRASLGLTQKQLAEKAGVSEPTIIDIERKRVSPRAITAYAILAALNEVLKEKGREQITIGTLDWKLQGES